MAVKIVNCPWIADHIPEVQSFALGTDNAQYYVNVDQFDIDQHGWSISGPTCNTVDLAIEKWNEVMAPRSNNAGCVAPAASLENCSNCTINIYRSGE